MARTADASTILMEIGSPQACERILQLGRRIGRHRPGSKGAQRDVEKACDLEELLCREGPVPALDLAQAALRQVEPRGQIGLRPLPFLAILLDLSRNVSTRMGELVRGAWAIHIDCPMKVSTYRYAATEACQ